MIEIGGEYVNIQFIQSKKEQSLCLHLVYSFIRVVAGGGGGGGGIMNHGQRRLDG